MYLTEPDSYLAKTSMLHCKNKDCIFSTIKLKSSSCFKC